MMMEGDRDKSGSEERLV
uniref:E3 ubiquitin-protein ligase RING1-like n=1 Tax=Rhizophora mucronata TaxID=61149 RepID=A0A2P2JVY5_RHIMU